MKENRIDLSKLIGKKFKVPEIKYKRFKEDKPATIYSWGVPKRKRGRPKKTDEKKSK